MIRYETEDQAQLRRRIYTLERLQTQRIELVAEQKKQMDATVERAQRELDNLRAQVTIQ